MMPTLYLIIYISVVISNSCSCEENNRPTAGANRLQENLLDNLVCISVSSYFNVFYCDLSNPHTKKHCTFTASETTQQTTDYFHLPNTIHQPWHQQFVHADIPTRN